jgi:hypothetical protein
MTSSLAIDTATRLAEMARANVTREFPNKLDHVLTGPRDVRGPRELHPIFYGSFDWHSCVHGYWLLTRLYRRFDALRDRIAPLIDTHVTPDNVAAEIDYLRDPIRATFERPYGMAWLLMLGAELAQCPGEPAARWQRILAPLIAAFAARMRDFLAAAHYPLRAGMHSNSAFALTLAFDYAQACGDCALEDAIKNKARQWFGGDVDCQAWEPDGEDFLSPALTEALCMSRVLDREEFRGWLDRFLPRLARRQPQTLFVPAVVNARSDLRFSHLDGLNLSRAWCWRMLGAALDNDDPRRAIAATAAEEHLAVSLPYIADNYAGSHWLGSFALLALDA